MKEKKQGGGEATFSPRYRCSKVRSNTKGNELVTSVQERSPCLLWGCPHFSLKGSVELTHLT